MRLSIRAPCSFSGVWLRWGASGVWRSTRLGTHISVFGGDGAWGKSLPQRKGFLKCSRFLLLPQKVTFIQRRKKGKKKKTRCPSPGSLPSPRLLFSSPPGRSPGGLAAGQALSDEVGNIERHLLDGGIVEGLDIAKSSLVFFRHHVYGHTLTPKTATTTNSVNIVFPVSWKVIVDD